MREEHILSADARKFNAVLEKKFWVLDYLFRVYLCYISFFEKPFWCTKKSELIASDCTEDIYGNDYYLWQPLPFVMYDTFLPTTIIMLYFICKHYSVYINMDPDARIYRSSRFYRIIGLMLVGLSHFLFYFFVNDGVFSLNVCSLLKLLYLIMLT